MNPDPFRQVRDILEPHPSASQFNDANKAHAIAYGALTILLLDKGIITKEDYDRAFAQATVIIDQEFARKRDEHNTGDNE